MEDLPQDILTLIFLALPLTLKDKLTISALSRRLRAAALDALLLWSSIEIVNSSDLLYLEIVLERSRDALLDISVVPFGYRLKPVRGQAPFDTVRLVVALLPHVARLRSFTVFLHDLAPLFPLLSEKLVLENLQKLIVHGSSLHYFEKFLVSLSAPQLRVLDLCASAAARNLSALAPHATNLTLTLSHSADIQGLMDELAANLAQSLSSLKLMQAMHDDLAAPLVGPWVFPRLQELDICVRSVRAVQMLRAIPAAHAQYVHVALTDYEHDYRSIVHPAMQLLQPGREEIVSFSIRDLTACSMLFSSGRRREFEGAPPQEPQLHRYIWDCLCDSIDAHNSVTSTDLDTRMWYLYQTAFAQRAPSAPEFTLRVTPCFMSNDLRPLNFPTLSKVVLMGNGTGSPGLWMADLDLAEYQYAVPWLARGALRCSRSEVELCTCGISQANERAKRISLREWIREELQPEGCLTADARCVIGWILCPGNCMVSR